MARPFHTARCCVVETIVDLKLHKGAMSTFELDRHACQLECATRREPLPVTVAKSTHQGHPTGFRHMDESKVNSPCTSTLTRLDGVGRKKMDDPGECEHAMHGA